MNYRTLCVKAGNPAPPSDYTVWCTPVTEAEYNRLASPNSRGPVYEIGYLPGDLRGEKYDKVNLFLERSTCLSYITFLVSEGIASASTRYVLLEIPVKNVRLFDHVAGHKSTFFNRDGCITWAINNNSDYTLNGVEKSLQRVYWMEIPNGIGGILRALCWERGFAWDFWVARKIAEELPTILTYYKNHPLARIEDHDLFYFYRNLILYIGVHAVNVFNADTNQRMRELVDLLGLRLERPYKTMDCLRGSTQLADFFISDMEIDQAELSRAAAEIHE